MERIKKAFKQTLKIITALVTLGLLIFIPVVSIQVVGIGLAIGSTLYVVAGLSGLAFGIFMGAVVLSDD